MSHLLDGDYRKKMKTWVSGNEFLILTSLPRLVRPIQVSWASSELLGFLLAVLRLLDASFTNSDEMTFDIMPLLILLRKTDLGLVTIRIVVVSGSHCCLFLNVGEDGDFEWSGKSYTSASFSGQQNELLWVTLSWGTINSCGGYKFLWCFVLLLQSEGVHEHLDTSMLAC